MIYDCPACGAALMYDPASGKMECLSCGNLYKVSQLEKEVQKAAAAETTKEETAKNTNHTENNQMDDDMMECNIYSCTACGAELAINGVESSTFCAYCGQPTIVFSRVSSAKKPKHIIPFVLTKEQAVSSIRKHLSNGFFVPKEIQNFEIERVRGIYVPFWIYDIDYSDEQYLSGRVKSGKHHVTRYYFRAAKTTFYNLTLDASKQLSDESSQRLEPYRTNALKPFDTGYLSGFYADCFDMNSTQLTDLARRRSMEMFNQQVVSSVHASNVQILQSHPEVQITKSEYAMFPAWFLTFRYNNEPYTILVNGQTGKVVGAVPYNKAKVNAVFWLIGIIASFFATLLAYALLNTNNTEGCSKLLFYLCLIGVTMWTTGINKLNQVKKSIALSKSAKMNRFVKDRQEG